MSHFWVSCGHFRPYPLFRLYEVGVQNTGFSQIASSKNPQKKLRSNSTKRAHFSGHFELLLARIGSRSFENDYKTCFPYSTWLIFQVHISLEYKQGKSSDIEHAEHEKHVLCSFSELSEPILANSSSKSPEKCALFVEIHFIFF